jgi:hypothetical protein
VSGVKMRDPRTGNPSSATQLTGELVAVNGDRNRFTGARKEKATVSGSVKDCHFPTPDKS